ncbi:MAG: 6-bladed beta-propeller, partial [Tannerella sp.]|nr:6-bladed beta-propeller [Tannerella sp.]
MINKFVYLLFIAVCGSCTQHAGTEKHQGKRDKIVNVRDKVKEIAIEDVLIGSHTSLYMICDYLIIIDYKSMDELIHIFDKNNFNHVLSAIPKGEGPGEIVVIGSIVEDNTHRRFFVSDHGKQKIFSYDLDSLLADPSYMPNLKMNMKREQLPSWYRYINDTLCIGVIIEPIGVGDFKPTVGRWNMNTGEITLMPYEHPDIKRKRFLFAASVEHEIYAECYSHYDLMTVCTLAGELKYNIYGPDWKNGSVRHYSVVDFCGDKIFALYSGAEPFYHDAKGEKKSNAPT